MRRQKGSFFVDEVNSRNIDSKVQGKLIELFGEAIVSISQTFAREAKFNTTDFTSTKPEGCEGFVLLISRARADSNKVWFGAFQRGDERLEVIGRLSSGQREVS